MAHSLGHNHGPGDDVPTVDLEKRRKLQERIDTLLSGKVHAREEDPDRGLFAPFLSSDKERAASLYVSWVSMAEEIGGLEGLELAIDDMYRRLGSLPRGMVGHAAKLFLTHFPLAREHLLIRSLEERQPELVQPSGQTSRPSALMASGKAGPT